MKKIVVLFLLAQLAGCGGRGANESNSEKYSPKFNQLFMEAVGDHYSREAKAIACSRVVTQIGARSISAWKTYLSIRSKEVTALESLLIEKKGTKAIENLRKVFLEAEIKKLNNLKTASTPLAIGLCMNENTSFRKGEILKYYHAFYKELLSLSGN